MNPWPMIVAGSLTTFLLRYPLISLSNKVRIPSRLRRVFRLVPAAILPALIVPAVLAPEGHVFLSFANYRIWALLAAGFAARRTSNVMLVLIIGLGTFYILQLLGTNNG